jgi:hypothetical protein
LKPNSLQRRAGIAPEKDPEKDPEINSGLNSG